MKNNKANKRTEVSIIDKLDVRAVIWMLFVIGFLLICYGRFEISFVGEEGISKTDERCEYMTSNMGTFIDGNGINETVYFSEKSFYDWMRTKRTCKSFVSKPSSYDGLDFSIVGSFFILSSIVLYGFYFLSKRMK